MKVNLYKDSHLSEPEIDIHFHEITNTFERVIQYIHQQECYIEGILDNAVYPISINEILYIDTVDKKTFLYTNNQIYESKQKLLAIEQTLSKTTLVRIGKHMLMNIAVLHYVKPYPNHRMLAILKNEEQLIVSRKYIPSLQERIRGLYYV